MDPQDNNQPNGAARQQPPSAPAVPKELMSARPAMTRVVPRSPDKVTQSAQPTTPPELTPEELAERQERLEYLRNLRGKDSRPRKGGGKKWLLVLVILLVLAALAGGVFWFFNKSAKPAPVATQPSNTTQKQAATPTKTDTAAVNLKDYQSTNFAVSLKYPADWTVSDTAQKLTITSTQQSLPGASGQKVNGQVVLTLRPKQPALDEFKTGNASAVLDSKKINYTEPAAGQRGSTYISYLQYAKTTVKGALDGIYVTGNSGYQKGQYVPQADVVKVDPLITVSFTECANDSCAANAPAISVQASDWAASDLNKTIEAMLQSLAIS